MVFTHGGEHDVEAFIVAYDVVEVYFGGIGVEDFTELALGELCDTSGHAAEEFFDFIDVNGGAVFIFFTEVIEEDFEGHAHFWADGEAEHGFEGAIGLKEDGEVGEVIAAFSAFKGAGEDGEGVHGLLAVVVGAWGVFGGWQEVEEAGGDFIGIAFEDGVIGMGVEGIIDVEEVEVVGAAGECEHVGEFIASIAVEFCVDEYEAAAALDLLEEDKLAEGCFTDAGLADDGGVSREEGIGDIDGFVIVFCVSEANAFFGVHEVAEGFVGGKDEFFAFGFVGDVEEFLSALVGEPVSCDSWGCTK